MKGERTMYKITVPTVVTNGHFNKEKTLAEMKRCGAERIGLVVDRELEYAFTSPENLKLIKELIQYYKENGIETLVWLGETIGHRSGKATDNSPYDCIRNIDKGDINAYCPLGEKFRNDFCTWVKNIAQCGADMIMLDDDFRLAVRGGNLGCFCDLHMAKLEEELGEKITPEELKPYLVSGSKNKYRSAWIKVQNESMIDFAKELREALDTVSPSTRLGICCVGYMAGFEQEVTQIMAGKTKPFMRLCGAPYWGAPLPVSIEIERTQKSWYKNSNYELFSEGDTYPRPRFVCSASKLECFDMILRASGEMDGILKYMLDYVSDADYETGYIDNMVKNIPLYTEIDKHFGNKRCLGVRPYNVMKLYEGADIPKGDDAPAYLYYPSLYFAVSNSLPITYEDGNVNILFGENARHIKESELKNGNIIDINAAKILISRGIDVGIKNFLDDEEYIVKGFTDVPSEYFPDEDLHTRLDLGPKALPIETDDNAEGLSYIKKGDKLYYSAYRYENSDGMKFLVFNFNADDGKNLCGWFTSYARRRQVEETIIWMNNKSLPAHIDGNYPYLYIMTKGDEASMTVGLWNLFDDAIDNARIKINIDFKNVKFINCEGHTEGNTIVLDTPLHHYKFAAFKLGI